MSNQEVYQNITDRVLARMDKGEIPWLKPWRAGGAWAPLNVATRKAYRGWNIWALGLEAIDKGYESPWWGTYGQWAERCGMVKKTNPRTGKDYWFNPDRDISRGVSKGQEGTLIMLWKKAWVKTDELDDQGKQIKKRIMLVREFKVWNAEQCDSVPERYLPSSKNYQPVAELQDAQNVIDSYLAHGPAFEHVRGNSAYYSPALDKIVVPERDQYDTSPAYYGVVFHEAGHSTGHEDRLNRPGIAEFDHFGSGKYAKEELAAQMTSALLQAITGTEDDAEFTRTVAYLQNWRKALEADPKLLPQAASAASKAADYILGITHDEDNDEDE